MQSRSNGIAGVAALALVSGVLSIFAGWWLMLGGTVGSTFGAGIGATVVIFGALMFALGVVELAVGYGLWRAKPWARMAVITVFGASIAIDIGSVLFANADPLSVVLNIAVAVVVIGYVMQPKVRSAFAH
jgi:Predicted membrane protein (DUF2127)